MKLKATIEVTYDPTTTDLTAEELANALYRRLFHAVGNGILSGDDVVEVEDYSITVVEE